MDIIEKIDLYLNEMMLDTKPAELRARKAEAMVDINKWAQKNNVDINKRLPRIGGDTYSAGLTKKEKKKLGITTNAMEVEHWKVVQNLLLYQKKKFAAGQIGTMWKYNMKYKDIVYLQRNVNSRVKTLKDMITRGKK